MEGREEAMPVRAKARTEEGERVIGASNGRRLLQPDCFFAPAENFPCFFIRRETYSKEEKRKPPPGGRGFR